MNTSGSSSLQRAKVIEGDRISLFELLPDDLALIYEWFMAGNPERITCRPIIPKTLEERKAGFVKVKDDPLRGSLAVIRNDDGALLGRVTYFDLNTRNGAVEIGYLLGPPYRGHGYGHEAVQLLLTHLFENIKVNKVMAQTGEFNEPSVTLLKSLGFTQDGRLRQHHSLDGVMYDDLVFSLLKGEFKR